MLKVCENSSQNLERTYQRRQVVILIRTISGLEIVDVVVYFSLSNTHARAHMAALTRTQSAI